MKITVNVDCTPLEARQFMGLPDVEPMQKAAMAEVEKRMMAELERFSPRISVQGVAADRRHERRVASGVPEAREILRRRFLGPFQVEDPFPVKAPFLHWAQAANPMSGRPPSLRVGGRRQRGKA